MYTNMALHASDKWRITAFTALIVMLLFNHQAFLLVNSLLGRFVGPICDSKGCPTMLGFGLHLVVFAIVLRYSMEIRMK